MLEQRFYVYAHHKKSDGSLFYIGKGTKGRARNTTHRSEWWKRISQKHGVSVRMVKTKMPEVCALSLERALIAAHGRAKLANLSDGGDGVSSPSEENKKGKSALFSGSRNPAWDHKVYDFYHPKYGFLSCNKRNFRAITGMGSPALAKLVKGSQGNCMGWSMKAAIKETRYKSGPNKKTIEDVRIFRRADGLEWVGNPYDFRITFNLNQTNVWKLTSGMRSTYKGWSLA